MCWRRIRIIIIHRRVIYKWPGVLETHQIAIISHGDGTHLVVISIYEFNKQWKRIPIFIINTFPKQSVFKLANQLCYISTGQVSIRDN